MQEVVKLYREKCGSIGQAEQAFILCSLNVWARETADSKMFSVQTLDRLIPF